MFGAVSVLRGGHLFVPLQGSSPRLWGLGILARCVPVLAYSCMCKRVSEIRGDRRPPFDVVSVLTDISLPDPWKVSRSVLVKDLASRVQAYVFWGSVASEMCLFVHN